MIVGITGNARHGKDTIADYMVSRYGFVKRSFAAPIKEACGLIFGWDAEWLYGRFKETVDPRYGLSPREAMQLLGTEFGQFSLGKLPEFAEVTGRSLWVKRTLSEIDEPLTVIPDVRFLHEAASLRAHGARIVKVIRPSVPMHLDHASESEVPKIEADSIIWNDGEREDLYRKIDSIMHVMLDLYRKPEEAA